MLDAESRLQAAYGRRRVLVTGASGFIGAHLIRSLARSGARVHGVARKDPGMPRETMEWHRGDLGDPDFVRDVIQACHPEIVFHLASHVSGSRGLEAVFPTLRGNLVSTVNVLQEMTREGCHRVVLAGSMEEPDSEGAAPLPGSPYAAAKWAASGYARMFHALYETPVALARIFMVYGPGQWDDGKLVPYVIRSLLRGNPPQIGSGVRPVDWIYVDDVVAGLLAMGAGRGPLARSVDLGTGVLTTVREVVEQIEGLMGMEGEARFGTRPDRPLEQVRKADVAASEAALGWRPAVSLREGLEKTIEWCRETE